MPISVVFSVLSCGSEQDTRTTFIDKYENARDVARRNLHSGRASYGPRSHLWHLPLSHLLPSLRVIPCEYVDDPYIAEN